MWVCEYRETANAPIDAGVNPLFFVSPQVNHVTIPRDRKSFSRRANYKPYRKVCKRIRAPNRTKISNIMQKNAKFNLLRGKNNGKSKL